MFAFTRKDIDARVVGSALVVSFNSVDVTKTWRAEMAGLSSATFELKEDNKKFSVILKKPDAADEAVATYTERESAAYALNAISTAMLKGDTRALAAQGGQAMAIMTKIFKAAVVILLLMVVYTVVAPAFLKPAGLIERRGMPGLDSGQTRVSPGEPIPADELFNKK